MSQFDVISCEKEGQEGLGGTVVPCGPLDAFIPEVQNADGHELDVHKLLDPPIAPHCLEDDRPSRDVLNPVSSADAVFSPPIHSPTPCKPFNAVHQWERADTALVPSTCKGAPSLPTTFPTCTLHSTNSENLTYTPVFTDTDSDILENSSFGDLVNFAPLSPNALAEIVTAHPGTNSNALDDNTQTDSSDSFNSEITLPESLRTNTTSTTLASFSSSSSFFVANASPASVSLALSEEHVISNNYSSSPGPDRIGAISPLPPSSPPLSSSPVPFFSELSQPSSQTSQPNSAHSQENKSESQEKHAESCLLLVSAERNQRNGGDVEVTLPAFNFLSETPNSPGMNCDSELSESLDSMKPEVHEANSSNQLKTPVDSPDFLGITRLDGSENSALSLADQGRPVHQPNDQATSTQLKPRSKRRREEELDGVVDDVVPTKRRAVLPTTHRLTNLMRQKEQEKLIKPFRSPVLDPAKASSARQTSFSLPAPPIAKSQPEPAIEVRPPVDPRTKHRTVRASAQFKSPLATSSAQPSGTIRLTPTIQALEGQLQTLRRAIKIKEQDEEAELKALVLKWREVGQEVAYELWNLTRENSQANAVQSNSWRSWDEGKCSNKRGFEDSWGWDDQGDEKRQCTEKERYRGAEDEAEMEEQPQGTMGTMLRQLGIAPETLHWDEEAESFV